MDDPSQIVEQNLKVLNLSKNQKPERKFDQLCKTCVSSDPVEYKEWTIINQILQDRAKWIAAVPDIDKNIDH